MSRKQKGGSFTGNQLHDLLAAGYAKDESYAASSMNVVPLDKTNNFLFNETFQVFIDQDNIRFIVIHRGTEGTIRDWGNNLRNLAFGNKRTENAKMSLTTNRQLVAENGYKNLRKYLEDIYAKRETNDVTELQKKIISTIEQNMKSIHPQIGDITISEAIEQLLKTRMSVLGHSQGAVYAYLYGNDGAETIVYNPAPFHGKKPDNVYIIRRKGDPVSAFTKSTSNSRLVTLDKLESKSMADQHSIEPLNGVSSIFGNKFIFSKDIEIDNGKKSTNNETIEAYNDDGTVVQSNDVNTIGSVNQALQNESKDINNATQNLQSVGGKIKKNGHNKNKKSKKRGGSRKIKNRRVSRKL